jgi:hypothetical protein
MSLTSCPYCFRQCFTDAASCPSCERAFQPGVLQALAVAKEKAFSRKADALFLTVLVILLAVLLIAQVQTYSPELLRPLSTERASQG